jgi:hypothetical protein
LIAPLSVDADLLIASVSVEEVSIVSETKEVPLSMIFCVQKINLAERRNMVSLEGLGV